MEKRRALRIYGRRTDETAFLTRIVNATTMDFTEERLDRWFDCPVSCGVDIFPYSYLPRNKGEELEIRDLIDRAYTLIQLNDHMLEAQKNGKKEEAARAGEILAERLLDLQNRTGFVFTAERPLANQCAILIDQLCRLTTAEEADDITRWDIYFDNPKFKFRKESYEHPARVPFEHMQIEVPNPAEDSLKIMYGPDYMKYVRFTSEHSYPYYGKQIRVQRYKPSASTPGSGRC